MRVQELTFLCGITALGLACGRSAENRRSGAPAPVPPLPAPAACAYRDIPGQAEFIIIGEKAPRDAAAESLTFAFRPDRAEDFQRLAGTFDQTNGDGKIIVADISYPRSCIAEHGLAVGAKLPMLWRTITSGTCDPWLMSLPSLPPGCQQL